MSAASDLRVNDPDPFVAARADIEARISAFAEGADIWETRDRLDEAQAAKANDFIAGAKKLAAEAEAQRKREKQPHLDAGRAVDATWAALISRIDKIIDVVKPKLAAYLREQEAKRRAEAEEAARKQREAEEAARAAAIDAANAESASQRIAAEERAAGHARIAEEAAAEAEARNGPARAESATGLANRRALRTVRRPAIVSLPLALAHYRDDPELRDLILKLAARDLREAPVRRGEKHIPTIPGIRWVETQEL